MHFKFDEKIKEKMLQQNSCKIKSDGKHGKEDIPT